MIARLNAPTMTGGNMAVRARGSTGCTTSASSCVAVVRLELERSRVIEPSVRVRCIFRVADAILPRCLTDAYIGWNQHSSSEIDTTGDPPREAYAASRR
jgi:hypothetical protein